jgi:hypothetical protein
MDELIIRELQQIPLVKDNHYFIKKLLRKLFPAVLNEFDIQAGATIIRVNNNTEDEPIFSKVERISYMPNELNSEYQRASTPYNTMFYGVIVQISDQKNARYAAAFEVNKFLRENIQGKQTITVSKWQVIKPLKLFSITKDISSVQNYLANEFSKEVDKNCKEDYMISAIMSEIIVEQEGYDGVIYPSVQTHGSIKTLTNETINPLCLALSPRLIDEGKIKPVLASQHKVIVDENGKAKLFKAFNCCEIQEGQKELTFSAFI